MTARQPNRRTRRKSPHGKRHAGRRAKGTGNFVNFFVPLFFIVCILFCLGFLAFMGYRTVTASAFFDVKQIEVKGRKKFRVN